jgi:hypothetical protein
MRGVDLIQPASVSLYTWCDRGAMRELRAEPTIRTERGCWQALMNDFQSVTQVTGVQILNH